MADLKNPTPPFATGSAPVAPAAPAAPTAAPAAPAAAPVAAAEEAPAKKRSAVTINKEHIDYVIANVKTMSYTDMAANLDLSKNQVNRILQEVKQGLRMKAIAADSNAYPVKGQNKKGEDMYDWAAPVSDLAKKVESKIAESLTRPAESRPGGSKGGGATKTAINAEIDNLLNNL